MTNIAFYCQYDKRVKDDIFLSYLPEVNEYIYLTKQLLEIGLNVHTLDVYKKQYIEPDICIFLDIPTLNINKLIDISKTKSIALLREAELINPVNYDKKRNKEFDYILTWKSSLLDNKKYFFIPSTRFVKEQHVKINDYLNRKLCVLMNSNLSSKLNGELYSHRLKAIKWFEKNHLEDFDLYGFGWDELRLKIRNKTIFKSKLLAPKRVSYKSVVENKLQTMSQYRFAICFENTDNVEDYVTEKIFDCFLAQTVPIYWGAPNIGEIIPKKCYIDFRDFKSYDELYFHIKNISNDKYMEYINAINKYLNSSDAYKYTIDNWVGVVKNAIYTIGEY